MFLHEYDSLFSNSSVPKSLHCEDALVAVARPKPAMWLIEIRIPV